MKLKFHPWQLKAGGLAAALIMSLTAAVPPLSFAWVNEARLRHHEAEIHLSGLRRVQELLVDAETGQRGYVITGKDSFLQPYHAAQAALPAELAALRHHGLHQPAHEREQLERLARSVELRLANLQEIGRLRQRGGFAAAEPLISSGQGQQLTDEIRRIVAEVGTLKARELAALDKELSSKIRYGIGFSLLSTLLTLTLLGYLGLVMSRAVRASTLSSEQAHHANERLEAGLAVLQRRNGEITMLGEMSRVLQTEMSLVEVLEVTALFCARLLPGTSGSIYLFRNSANLLELATGWGSGQHAETTLDPTVCWGLRRGQLHRSDGASGLRCPHCQSAEATADEDHVCLPLIAYGEVLGLLHFHGTARSALPEAAATMAQTIAEQIALALSNAKLRQVLRDQSIRDPLTGMYNRRYMEETLAREMARAQRNGQSLSVVAADLDNFKRINDVYGHPAGDAVLRAAARQMSAMVRTCDVACRQGGEEFALILANCGKQDALAKAQQICEALRTLVIREAGQPISVTASFGVASMPEDGGQPALLLQAADRALYAAKRAGRNRVVAFDSSPVPAEPAAPIEA